MTRADRIRSMTDEELAKALMDANDNGLHILFCKDAPECQDELDNAEIPEERCLVCMMDWLRQTVDGAEVHAIDTTGKEYSGLLEE